MFLHLLHKDCFELQSSQDNSSQCELTRKGSVAHLLTFSMVSLKLLKMILYMEKANIICPNPYQNRSVTLQMRAKNKSMLETLFIDEFHSS